MSKKNYNFNIFLPLKQSTRPSEIVADETTHTITDQDITNLIVRDENILISTSRTHNDGIFIQMGDCEVLEMVNNPVVVTNNSLFDNQPIELDIHHAPPTDEILYLPNPINWNIGEDFLIPLSPELQNAAVHVNITYDTILLNEQETWAELIQNENYDSQMFDVERTAIQTVESPTRHEPISEIHNFSVGPIVEIDLTQDDNDNEEVHEGQSLGVVSPVVIDLTQDDNSEEVHQVQLLTSTDRTNGNEQINQSENNPSVLVASIMKRTSLSSIASLEATDQNPNITIDSNETIEATAHLQVSILSSRTNKRSSSLDEIRHADKKDIDSSVKRWRNSFS